MLRELCNEFCIRMCKKSQQIMGQAAAWLAAKAGLKVVSVDALVLPVGFGMFNIELAKQIGINSAIIHQRVYGWNQHNRRKGINIRKDRAWTYDSHEDMQAQYFPWLSVPTLKREITKLKKAGLLIVDRFGGKRDSRNWYSAILPEAVQIASAIVQFELPLYQNESGGDSKRPPSIENQTTLKQPKKKKQTPISPRKDAVADFQIPEMRDQAAEIREPRDVEDEGYDELSGLPAALVAGWRDTKVRLPAFVAQHGKEHVSEAYAIAKTQGYDNPIAGMRSILANSPSPSSASPPSPADIAKADHDEWVREFKASKYLSFISNADDLAGPDDSTEDDLDPGNTPDIDVEAMVQHG